MESLGRRVPTGASLFSLYASFSATFTLLRQAFHQFVPEAVKRYVYELFKQWFFRQPPPPPDTLTLLIQELDGMNRNEVFNSCQLYLCNRMNDSTNFLKVSRAPNEETMSFKLATGVTFFDSFEGIQLQWSFDCRVSTPRPRDHNNFPPVPMKIKQQKGSSDNAENLCSFSLSFNKEHKKKICTSYLPFVVETAKDIEREGKALRLHDCSHKPYTGSGKSKHSVKMTHPFTFDKLAIDPKMKKSIIDDLERFVSRKDFYRSVGKPWKRGYLLYGPPGTGKSSLIAAMANHLKFDIYDLQLTRSDSYSSDSYSSLRDMLLWLPSKTIIVVEDIDRTQGFNRQRRMNKPPQFNNDFDEFEAEKMAQMELAPLLNFLDGLWSCCGDERLIVLTTNHKEKLDPALLRPGRMDMHIHMSYLTMPGFKILAHNYLRVSTDHPQLAEIETLLKTVNATPAEVAEELLRSEDVDTALEGVVELLKGKIPKPEANGNSEVIAKTQEQLSNGTA